MSILALPRQRAKHPDPAQAALLAPSVHAPAERPRAIDAPRLNCKPGTSRAVLDELRADLDTVHAIQRRTLDGMLPDRRPRRGRTHLTASGLPRAVPLRHVPLTGHAVAADPADVAVRDGMLDALADLAAVTAGSGDADLARQWQLLLTSALPVAELLAEPLWIGGAL